nr:hypothetical protein [Tanacetum cinerariifolium]
MSLPDGVKGLEATIDGTSYTVTEASIRSALQLDDLNAIDTLTNAETFDRLWAIGYATEGKFTNIAIALICLSTRRKYNFSNMIFNDTETEDSTPYPAPLVTKKTFANMRHYQGPDMPLLAHMLNQKEPALVQAQPQEVSSPPPYPVVEPHPSTNPMPSPSRQSSPSPIPFGPAPSSGVASTDPIPEIPSPSRPTEPAQPQEVSPPPPYHVVEPHPSTNPMPSPSRQSSPSPIPFGPAPSSGVASTDPIPEIPSPSRPTEPVLETITSLIRDDDTAGGSFPERPLSPSPATPTRSPTEISPTTLDAVLTLSQSKIRARAAKIIYKQFKKKQSSSGLDFTDTAIPAAGQVSVGGADPADVISAGGADPADVVVSACDANSAGTFISADVSVAAVPSDKELADQQAAILEAEQQELFEQELKQSLDTEQVYLDSLLAQRVTEEQEREIRASTAQSTSRQAKLDRIALNLTNEEWIGLVDQRRKAIAEMKAKVKRDKPLTPAQQKEYMRAFVKNQSTSIYTTRWTWKDVRGLTDDQLQNVYNKIRRAVDLAIAKDHHQQLKRSGKTLKSSELKKLKSSHRTEQSAELLETTSVSAGATLIAGDPIFVVPFISAASSIPAETPIAAGVSIAVGVSESAGVASIPIIDLLDSPPKATSLPLDPAIAEHAVPLRKSLRKKYMARRRTLPRPSQSESAALPFDEEDPEAEFKKYLRPVSNDDEPAEPVSLSLDDQDQWEIRSWRFYALLAIHVLETEAGDIMYMFVDKKYPILLATIQRMLTHGLEIDQDPFDLLKVCRALTMSARVLNFSAFKLEEIVMAMMTCLKSSGVHYQCFTVECKLLWLLLLLLAALFSILTLLMMIYYWKLDNKQVTI